MGISYNADQVRGHLIGSGVWPAGDANEEGVAGARDWWVRLIKQVTYGVNDHPWGETEDVADAVGEITGIAVDQLVTEARSSRAVLRLLDLSNVREMDLGEEVELRLHQVITTDPTQNMYQYASESSEEYQERLSGAQEAHREYVGELLELRSVTGIYLEAAAVTVARPWCEALAEEVVSALEEADEEEMDEDE